MVFTPGSALIAGVTYTCTVDTSAKDSAGNTMSSTKEWSFTAVSGEPPYIIDMKIGGYKTQPGEAISPQVKITATIIDPDFLPPLCGISTIEISANSQVYRYSTSELSSIFTSNTGYLDFRFPASLDTGIYTITLRAWDVQGYPTEESVSGLRVNAGTVKLDGNILNYPYMFESGHGTTFAYKLTADATIWIRIYSIGGIVYFKKFPAGTSGGTAGYNEVFWDGLTGSGSLLSNGMYIVKIYHDDKALGTSRLIIMNKE
jgi:hypothetical protein